MRALGLLARRALSLSSSSEHQKISRELGGARRREPRDEIESRRPRSSREASSKLSETRESRGGDLEELESEISKRREPGLEQREPRSFESEISRSLRPPISSSSSRPLLEAPRSSPRDRSSSSRPPPRPSFESESSRSRGAETRGRAHSRARGLLGELTRSRAGLGELGDLGELERPPPRPIGARARAGDRRGARGGDRRARREADRPRARPRISELEELGIVDRRWTMEGQI